MNALEFASGDVLLLFAGGVVETFHRAYDRSFRTPAAWIGVIAKPGKHDQISISIGRVNDPSQPVYGPSTSLSWTDIKFDLDAGEEPRVREFFAGVAGTAGRS
jgi:hypothetical protein